MKIFFATGNEGKVRHADRILEDVKVRQADVETIEPSLDSIEEIARAKVEQAREKVDNRDSLLIADDSGLFVDSLDGFPGPQTAFFDRKVGKEKLTDLIGDDNSAEFRAAIALDLGDDVKVFTGEARGEIVEPRGDGGFGYDPMFLPEGSDRTWGEDVDQKDEHSHRREALEELREYIRTGVE
ncbi:MAG: non-canonical purine NTP pyrophosphatase [Candidatus Nanohaloarchaea archaeon]